MHRILIVLLGLILLTGGCCGRSLKVEFRHQPNHVVLDREKSPKQDYLLLSCKCHPEKKHLTLKYVNSSKGCENAGRHRLSNNCCSNADSTSSGCH